MQPLGLRSLCTIHSRECVIKGYDGAILGMIDVALSGHGQHYNGTAITIEVLLLGCKPS